MSKKLNQDDLDVLQSIRKDTLDIASTLGELYYQKSVIEIQIDEEKEKIKQLKVREVSFFEELRKTYGNVVINIETGELTPQVS